MKIETFRVRFIGADEDFYKKGLVSIAEKTSSGVYVPHQMGMRHYPDIETFIKSWEVLDHPENEQEVSGKSFSEDGLAWFGRLDADALREIIEGLEKRKKTPNWLNTSDFSLMKKITEMQENEAHCKEVFEFMAPSSNFVNASTAYENCLRLIGSDGIKKSIICLWNDGVIVVEGNASISKPFALVNLIRSLGYDKT